MSQHLDAIAIPGGQVFDAARRERNWLIFGLFKPKDGVKVGKRPVSRGRPWITVGVQNAAVLTFDEAWEFVQGVQLKHLVKYNAQLKRMTEGTDTPWREMVGVSVGYLAREGSAMVVVDLDGVLDSSGALTSGAGEAGEPWAALLDGYEGYAEISSSGNGLRLLMPRWEGCEDLSSGSELGGGCFVAKGEKGMALTFRRWAAGEGVGGTEVVDDWMGRMVAEQVVSLRDEAKKRRGRVGGAGEGDWSGLEDAQAAFDEWGYIGLDELEEILLAVPNEGIGREEWIGLMFAIKEYYGALGLEEEAWALFDDWTTRREDGGAYDYDANRAAWDGGGKRGAGSRTTMASWLWRYHEAVRKSDGGEDDGEGDGEGDGDAEAFDFGEDLKADENGGGSDGKSDDLRDGGREDWWGRLAFKPSDAEKKTPLKLQSNLEQMAVEAPWLCGYVREGLVAGEYWRMREWDKAGTWLSEPVRWKDSDDVAWTSRVQGWEKKKGVRPFLTWPVSMFDRALRVVKGRCEIWDPIRVELDRLPAWDGIRRIDTWLVEYLGVQDTPWARVCGRRFLVAMVARGMQGGAKVDTALVLHGAQGVGKSSVCAVLAGKKDLFTDRLSNLAEKDSAGEVGGKWVVEIAEGLAVSKSDREATKAFMSRVTDKYRPPYGRNVVEQDRRCVFVMTTNQEESLLEGGRRFWPVSVGHEIDLEGLKAVRALLLSEARVAYDSGEQWWLDPEEVKLHEEVVLDYVHVHAWETQLRGWLRDKSEVTTGEVLFELGVSTTESGARGLQMQIADVLKRWKWDLRRNRHRRSWVRTRESVPVMTVTKGNVTYLNEQNAMDDGEEE